MTQPANLQSSPLEKRQALQQQRSGPSESKLPNAVIALMLCTTVAIDVAQILLDLIAIGIVLNPIIDFCVWLGFYIWFKIRGMNMGQAKKALTFLGGGALEMFFDGTVPLWTLDIGTIIFLEKAEEKMQSTNLGKVAGKAASVV